MITMLIEALPGRLIRKYSRTIKMIESNAPSFWKIAGIRAMLSRAGKYLDIEESRELKEILISTLLAHEEKTGKPSITSLEFAFYNSYEENTRLVKIFRLLRNAEVNARMLKLFKNLVMYNYVLGKNGSERLPGVEDLYREKFKEYFYKLDNKIEKEEKARERKNTASLTVILFSSFSYLAGGMNIETFLILSALGGFSYGLGKINSFKIKRFEKERKKLEEELGA